MAESAGTKTRLNQAQRARVIALDTAKIVLSGTGGMFGPNPNTRTVAELIEVSKYIIGTEKAAFTKAKESN